MDNEQVNVYAVHVFWKSTMASEEHLLDYFGLNRQCCLSIHEVPLENYELNK